MSKQYEHTVMDINKIDEALRMRDELTGLNNLNIMLGEVFEAINMQTILSTPGKNILSFNIGGTSFRIGNIFIQNEIRDSLLKYKKHLEECIKEIEKQIEEL